MVVDYEFMDRIGEGILLSLGRAQEARDLTYLGGQMGLLPPTHPCRSPSLPKRGTIRSCTGDGLSTRSAYGPDQELETVFGQPLHQDALSRKNAQLSGFGTSDHSRPGLSMNTLTHVDDSGKASMVNIMEKSSTYRLAAASGRVLLGTLAFDLVCANKISKGDVLTVAQIAGIQAAKQTSNLIPLCHNILLSGVKVDLSLNKELQAVEVHAEVTSVGPTGVEMEALTAVSVACLTVYDMCKAASKEIKISNIQLDSKSGGKSGDWHRTNM
ncbi:hypothetical protein O6H91_22G032400 [Diphasiastrum complanatum]|uniref:Uncharacterized protein n=1 Tax=Diphasiastrum complanatum TaxID=34168 RepID=A0ACC2AE79_DIPCM|nr:hypothetical protein O6H91_22G032400 [Diphasiastrum complanatum]